MIKQERGQATILALGLALLCFAIAGVAIDGTRAFLYRRTLQNAADAAALAGSSELDRASFYAAAGEAVGLSSIAARRAATEWLAKRGLPARASIEITDEGVRIVLRGSVKTTFLGLVGVGDLPVAVESTAGPVEG